MPDFKLSASLTGHEDDVRGVVFPSRDVVYSASRDTTVRSWRISSGQPLAFEESIAHHGSEFINSITFVRPTTDYPEGLLVSGGKDTIIDVRQPNRPPDSSAERLLLGHEGNVCSLDAFSDSKKTYLVSGSWDTSARIWDIGKGESSAVLEGHGGSVWAVLAYDAETIITGCADKKIRLFSITGKLAKTINGGNDVVRALCRMPSTDQGQFASAGNDAIIRLWNLEGVCLGQLHGHESFIYSLTTLPSGEIVSSSEDRTVRIWRDSSCIQTITHPAISVWSVTSCPDNGDIVTGASDRIVRVFSRESERQASAETLQQFDESVQSSSIPQQQMGDVNKEKLPGPDFLQNKSGTKEGQVQMIREVNGSITAHQWSTATNEWLHVGTVVDAANSNGRKQEYMGKDYDYVFDVDIEDGKPPLKLPFNLSQNPYEVAQKFIGDNELPISYLDQVANFIITNTQGATIGQSSGPSQPISDPWGQESRYRPGDGNAELPAPRTRPKILPQKEYLTIATASFSMMRKKIVELNDKLVSEGRKDISLNPGEIQALSSVCSQLESGGSAGAKATTMDLGIEIAIRIATQWPTTNQLPGLDLLRCLASSAPSIVSHDIMSIVHSAGLRPASAASQSTEVNANMIMLALRLLANIFNHDEGRKWALDRISHIRETVLPSLRSKISGVVLNRNVHIAATTLYINLAVLFDSTNPQGAASNSLLLLQDMLEVLQDSKIVDSETTYRALVAAGTFIGVLGGAKSPTGTKDIILSTEKKAKEPRIKAVVAEIQTLF